MAGREGILDNANVAIQRALIGRSARSQILSGLRGTGKTVLLRKIESIAEGHQCLTAFVEAPEKGHLAALVFPAVHAVLRKLSLTRAAAAQVNAAFRSLKSFAGGMKLSVGGFGIEVDAEAGVADSGDLETDLGDLFEQIGIAARAAGRAWVLFVDEIQYLSESELAALIVATHRCNQKNLPFVVFAAGLPSIAGLAGTAKSYAERLFEFPAIGALDAVAARSAIANPIEAEGEKITPDALAGIVRQSGGYAYFLQEWGYQCWNIADASPITAKHLDAAGKEVLRRLDEGFFRVRLDRLTPKETEYVQAMASLGDGPYRSGDVATKLGESVTALGVRRAGIIHKGMIYSPAHGDIAFTVPMFAEFLRRTESLG